MTLTIEINEDKLKRIKDRMEYHEVMLDHPELLATEEERQRNFDQWRGAHFILRNLGIKL
jgi:hypothetical protein